MRASRRVASLLLVMVALAGLTSRVVAQETTPTVNQPTAELLAESQAPGMDLLGGPAELWLIRFTFAPGAASPIGDESSAWILAVESGEIVVEGDGLFAATIGGSATPMAGASTLTAGDAVSGSPGIIGQARNESDQPADVLVFMTYPAAAEESGGAAAAPGTPAQASEPTVGFVAVGSAETLPDGPMTLRIERITLPAGMAVPIAGHGGPEVGFVETGSVELSLLGGAGFAFPEGISDEHQQQGPPVLAIGEPVVLVPGGFYSLDSGASGALSNAADGETVVFRATITAANPDRATPAA